MDIESWRVFDGTASTMWLFIPAVPAKRPMTNTAPTGPSLRPTPRFAGQAKATPSGRGRLLLQSRTHEVWARFSSSSMKDDLRYAPSDCFETFPFPDGSRENQSFEEAGCTYYEFRSALMVRNNEGLTKTYNRFHDPDESSPDILKLRELHTAMDRTVLDAYGWTELKPTCEFLLDYEEDEDEDESGGGRRRKKPWRYRWPDDFRDEVLARLLELNRQRAEEERLSGATAEGRSGQGHKEIDWTTEDCYERYGSSGILRDLTMPKASKITGRQIIWPPGYLGPGHCHRSSAGRYPGVDRSRPRTDCPGGELGDGGPLLAYRQADSGGETGGVRRTDCVGAVGTIDRGVWPGV